MVAKAAIDQLLVFVNYSEPGEANGGAGGPSLLGIDSPSRMDSPDSFSNALLFKDAVEIVAEDEGNFYTCRVRTIVVFWVIKGGMSIKFCLRLESAPQNVLVVLCIIMYMFDYVILSNCTCNYITIIYR